MRLLGVDPSFTHTGLALIEGKDIWLWYVGTKIGDKSFANVYKAVEEVVSAVQESVMSLVGRAAFSVVSEIPPASGSFASGLYGLDVSLMHMWRSNKWVDNVKYVYPNMIGHLHGTRKYNKSDSVELAKRVLNRLKELGFTVHVSGRLSNDMAEALLIGLTGVRYKDEDLWKVLIDMVPSYQTCKVFDLSII